MKKKGFTLIELLVVIAIIALLMGILMPALARVRLIAYRMVCGSNLAGIGKAIIVYSGDAEESYPMPGIERPAAYSKTGHLFEWKDMTEGAHEGGVYYSSTYPSCGAATIGSTFYLLVKYEDLGVKQFNCKGDVGVVPFSLTAYSSTVDDFTKAWDFGWHPGIYNSYSYNNPFANESCSGGYRASSNSEATTPLAADRNPTLDKNVDYITGGPVGGTANPTTLQTPYRRWTDSASATPTYDDQDHVYNSFAHQKEGQNVLYNDAHVTFETQANVGVDDDNIWQRWYETTAPTPPTIPDRKTVQVGGFFPTKPAMGNSYGAYTDITRGGEKDALLINEWHNASSKKYTD
jgi:prepilin-type N-terminal cleavage/methylation domain-containing protein